MHDTMMATAEQRHIGQLRLAAVGPVANVVHVAYAQTTPGKATATVAVIQRAPDRCRHGARTTTDIQHRTVTIVDHDDAARVAREAPARFRGKPNTTGKDRLT